jgi:hypothetical protein
LNVSQFNNRIKNVLRELGLKVYGPVAFNHNGIVAVVIPWSGSNLYEPHKYPCHEMNQRIQHHLMSIGMPRVYAERLHHFVPKRKLEFVFTTQVPLVIVEKMNWKYHPPEELHAEAA